MTGYQVYSDVFAQTTTKDKILLMLLDGALRFIDHARQGIEQGSPVVKGENISRVVAILSELDCALDRDQGGELAENLSSLYSYMIRRLTFANIYNVPDPLIEVEGLLRTLQEGFEGAVHAIRTPSAAAIDASTAVKRSLNIVA